MTLQQQGLDWENQIANQVTRRTVDGVRAIPQGYSGNHATPAGDIEVRVAHVDGVTVHDVEAKRHSKPRPDEPDDTDSRAYVFDQDDFRQLSECQYAGPAHCLVSFTNCEPLLVTFDRGVDDPRELAFDAAHLTPECFYPHVTDSGKLRLCKPHNTDVWPSAQAGRDGADVLIDELNLPRSDSNE